MTAYNTGNPIGSTDPRDLSDNAQNFDQAVNQRNAPTWTDRLGVTRKTVFGAFQEITYKTPVAYSTGLSFLTTEANKTVEEAGVVYAPLNSALPFTTSGTFAGDDDARFYPVQDKNNVIRVTSIAAMEAYSAPVGYVFSLNDGGRSGTFDVVAGDFSTELAADTLNGIYVGQANDPTAATKVAKRRYDGVISALWFGAGGAETEANNRTFLQSTIALLDFLGGGTCVMPYEAPYGLENDDATTFPDFTGVTSDLLVIDRSEASANGVEKAGFQERRFSHTAQTDPVGQHNGNGLRQFGDWAPYFWSENTAQYAAKGDGSRTAADNRRSSIFFATNGVANWRVGQGNFSGDLSEAEMSAFVIAVNGIPDLSITGLASAFVINKDNGNIGFNVADPGLPYLFAMRPGQTNAFKVQGDSDGGSLRIILDKGDGNENEVLVDSAGETRFIHNGETVARITAAGTLTSIKSIGGGAFTTTERNALGVLPAGVMVFDTTLSKPIWKPVTGTASWVDATGATV